MRVTVTLPAVLAQLAGDRHEIHLDAATVEEALQGLAEQEPGLKNILWREPGTFNPVLVVFRNDTDIRGLQGMATPLREGDEVAVISALEGG